MRLPAIVPSVAFALVCTGSCSSETVVGPASVPPTSTDDLGAPPADQGGGVTVDLGVPPADASVADGGAGDAGDAGDAGGARCAGTATRFASGITAGASDGSFLYGFGGMQVRRVALTGGAPSVVVDGINTFQARSLAVDATSVYWVASDIAGNFVDAVVRAPKSGGAASVAGEGEFIRGMVIADVIYVVGGSFLRVLPVAGGSEPAPLDRASFLTGEDSRLVYLGLGDAFELHTRPLAAPIKARSPGPADTDGSFMFVALPTNEVRRYRIADGTATTIYRWQGTNNVALRVDGDRVYVAIGNGALVRLSKDGSEVSTLVDTLDLVPSFTIAADTLYYTVGGDTWQICK